MNSRTVELKKYQPFWFAFLCVSLIISIGGWGAELLVRHAEQYANLIGFFWLVGTSGGVVAAVLSRGIMRLLLSIMSVILNLPLLLPLVVSHIAH